MEETSTPLPRNKRWGIFISVIAICVIIDQWSKVYAVNHWQGAGRQSFFNDIFRIEFALNRGAFMSLFSGLADQTRFFILVVANAIVLLGMSIWIIRSKQMTRYMLFAWSFIIGGGIGNLIDRIRFNYVIDYFNLGIGDLRTGIFNVADMAITAGFIMLLPMVFMGDPEAKPETLPSPSSSEKKPVTVPPSTSAAKPSATS